MYDPRQDTAIAQQEDLTMFGRLVFALCCNNLAAMNTLPKALDVIGRQYSVDVKTLALYLISKPGPHKVGLSHYHYSLHLIVSQNITQVIDMIGTNRLLHEMDDMHRSVKVNLCLCQCSYDDLVPSIGLKLNS
jgi:PAB-dependent poly(A)-specific ribonuclease subunit 3